MRPSSSVVVRMCAVDTGDGTVLVFHNRHCNRNQNGVVDIRTVETRVVDTSYGAVLVVVVETRVVDTSYGAVLVVVDIRTVETRVVDTRDGAVLVVDSFS